MRIGTLIKNILLIAITSLLFTMCKTTNNSELAKTAWKLEKLTINDSTIKIPADAEVNIVFPDTTAIYGKAGCNNYFGNYTIIKEDNIMIDPAGMTRMLCPYMDLEDRYIKAIQQVSKYSVSDDELTLSDDNNQTELVFVKIKNFNFSAQ